MDNFKAEVRQKWCQEYAANAQELTKMITCSTRSTIHDRQKQLVMNVGNEVMAQYCDNGELSEWIRTIICAAKKTANPVSLISRGSLQIMITAMVLSMNGNKY